MSRKETYIRKVDLMLVLAYLALVLMGWLSIYAATYSEGQEFAITLHQNYGRQIMWVGVCLSVAFFILIVDSKFFTNFSYPIYGVMMFMLLVVLFFGQEVKGAKAWLVIGSIKVQPAEFAKFATALALAKFMSGRTFKFKDLQDKIKMGFILALPIILILLQNDTGSMLAYTSFFLMFYREGMSGWILVSGVSAATLFILALLSPVGLIIGIALLVLMIIINAYLSEAKGYVPKWLIYINWLIIVFVIVWAMLKGIFKLDIIKIEDFHLYLLLGQILFSVFIVLIYRNRLKHIIKRYVFPLVLCITAISYVSAVDFAFRNILKPHQRGRIEVLLGMKEDPNGVGFHGIQSRMTIGSGGGFGKGWLQGTRTAGGYVPEQTTDFIFCTVGEEFGFLGSIIIIGLFIFFLLRIVHVAERQRSAFSRIYGYGVASIFFIHLVINIGMTIGLVPVIGIPLPFFSYGGSSLLAFTILLFIFIKLDSERLFLIR